MKYSLYVMAMMLMLSRSGLCETLDPTLDFCRQVVVDTQAIEQWSGFGVGPDEAKPPGGYLFRFECDINGDGRNELFLASSIQTEGGMCLWSIYSPDASMNYTKIASNVVGPPLGFYLKTSGNRRELQSVFINAKYGIAAINRYLVSDGKVVYTQQKVDQKDIEKLNSPGWKETFGIGDEIKSPVSKVLFSEYARNRAIAWRSYKPDFGARDQNQDTADIQAMAANSSFSVPTAKQLLGGR